MENQQVVEIRKEVVRRSCLRKPKSESEMKKAKIGRRVWLSTTEDVCAICSSDVCAFCAVCSKYRETNELVGHRQRKATRKSGIACNCKCKCHNKDETNTENVAPVERSEKELVELERDMALHRNDLTTKYNIANAQKDILVKLLGSRHQIHEEKKQYFANLQKLKDVLEWARAGWDDDVIQDKNWLDPYAGPYESAEEVLTVFFDGDFLKKMENAYEKDKFPKQLEDLLTDKIRTVEAQGAPCLSMQSEVDLVYFMLAKERLEIILEGKVILLGKDQDTDQDTPPCVKCEAIFPGEEISSVSQIGPLISTLDNRSPEDKLGLDALVRQEFGDKGEIDIVRLIQLFDQINGVAVDDGEFRGSTTADEEADEAFSYDVCYLAKSVFRIARGNTQLNVKAGSAELKTQLRNGVLVPRAGSVKGYLLPVAGSSAGM